MNSGKKIIKVILRIPNGTKTYIKVSLAKKALVMGKKTYLYLLVNTGTQVGPMATCPALTRHTSRTPHVAT